MDEWKRSLIAFAKMKDCDGGRGRAIADRLIYDGLTMATTVAFRRIMVDAIVDRNSRDSLTIVLAIDG